MQEYTNDLIKESSPYLLQHAHNPVNWVAWSDTVFEQAKVENKLVLISVGYSACHWCHVMEHECFEDEEVATLMNKFFINVKVDREERPDVDQVYMTAVQLMTQKGGWPLNCFTLPDGRPIYGGTYFPKEQWMHILKSLHHAQQNEMEHLEEYATNLHKGIISSEQIIEMQDYKEFEPSKLEELILRWSKSFDFNHGGETRAPKFPLPSNYEFLLDYALHAKNKKVMNHVELTLDKMAMGGIYDQVGGGFCRYAVDMLWKVPHFEKMLYDNGQLLSLYSTAYRTFPKPLYKRTVYQTINWLEREMSENESEISESVEKQNGRDVKVSRHRTFFSALDADSEGVEGKFYVWNEKELQSILGDDYSWVKEFYQVQQRGYWEDGNSILLRIKTDEEICKEQSISIEELETKIQQINETILFARSKRVRPGLDNKCITSWNAMTLKGLCDAYSTFNEEQFLSLAIKNAKWIVESQMQSDGSILRIRKNKERSINGFLDDYAHTIDAFISLYTVTFDEEWLRLAKQLTEYTLNHFFDEKSSMFYYTDDSNQLIARKMEVNDNVIPASNSVMAKNLFYLSSYFHEEKYKAISKQMLANVYDGMENFGSGYSNWALLLNQFVYGCYEVVITGGNAQEKTKELMKHSFSKVILAVAKKESQLPIFLDKTWQKEAMIQVCTDGSCLLPTTNIEEVLKTLRSS
ncbi:MAG TPA: thioredoxin domain-containing protein [Crocinitomicaceae bacterium]|nr:thioredoxin domain-containing protein [Crocinitomicaceae bacterium]